MTPERLTQAAERLLNEAQKNGEHDQFTDDIIACAEFVRTLAASCGKDSREAFEQARKDRTDQLSAIDYSRAERDAIEVMSRDADLCIWQAAALTAGAEHARQVKLLADEIERVCGWVTGEHAHEALGNRPAEVSQLLKEIGE